MRFNFPPMHFPDSLSCECADWWLHAAIWHWVKKFNLVCHLSMQSKLFSLIYFYPFPGTSVKTHCIEFLRFSSDLFVWSFEGWMFKCLCKGWVTRVMCHDFWWLGILLKKNPDMLYFTYYFFFCRTRPFYSSIFSSFLKGMRQKSKSSPKWSPLPGVKS